MTPAKAAVRASTRVKPVVRTAIATRQLEASLRRLGADEATVDTITRGRGKRRAQR